MFCSFFQILAYRLFLQSLYCHTNSLYPLFIKPTMPTIRV